MRHLRQVGRDEITLDVLAQADHQRVVVAAGRGGGEDIGQPDHFAVGVGHLDADGGLAGDRRQHPNALGRHRVGDIALQRSDFLDLDTRTEFHLVAGDGRPAGATGDRGVHLELLQNRGNGVHHLVVGRTVPLGRVTGDQQIQWRQGVWAVDNPVDRLGLLPGRLGFGCPGLGCLGIGRSRLLTTGFDRFGDGRYPGGRFIEWVVVIRRSDRTRGARPGRWFVSTGTRIVVVTVREVIGCNIFCVARCRHPVVVVVIFVVVVLGIVVIRIAAASGEHGVERRGHLTDGGTGDQQDAEQRSADQQRCGDPRRQPIRQRPAHGEPDESARPLPSGRVGGRARPQVPQAQNRQGDHRRTQNQTRAGFRVRLSAHQDHRDGGDQQRQQDHRPADEGPQAGVNPCSDRAGRVEPGRRGDDHGEGHQSQRDTVAAMSGFDIAGAADRTGGRSGTAGHHEPGRAGCPAAGRSRDGECRRAFLGRRGGLAGRGLAARRCRLRRLRFTL